MSLYKRPNSPVWYIQLVLPDGRRIQKSSGTTDRLQAQELHDKIKADSWRVSRLGDKPARYWEDAVKQWVMEQQGHKKSLRDDQGNFRWLHDYLTGKDLNAISRQTIADIATAKKATGVSNGRVNRMLALIRAVLNRAVREWEWIDKAPTVKLLPEPRRRVRWLTEQEAQRLLMELPTHLAEMARFTLATGLRESNVTGLKWKDVDLGRCCCWVHHDEMKNEKPLPVPLNHDAVATISRQLGKNQEYVFTYEGKPVTRCNNHAWVKALKRAGIRDFRWHDLRHTWASWHIQNGTPLHGLKELGGWQSEEMVKRYAHLSPGHLAEYAGNVAHTQKSAITPEMK